MKPAFDVRRPLGWSMNDDRNTTKARGSSNLPSSTNGRSFLANRKSRSRIVRQCQDSEKRSCTIPFPFPFSFSLLCTWTVHAPSVFRKITSKSPRRLTRRSDESRRLGFPSVPDLRCVPGVVRGQLMVSERWTGVCILRVAACFRSRNRALHEQPRLDKGHSSEPNEALIASANTHDNNN